LYKNKSHISQLFFLMGSDPNWRSSTILKEKKGKSIYISPLYYEPSQSAQAWITQFYLQIHHACLSFTAFTRCHYPRLTCSRWLTHMSSHPSLGVKRRIGKVCRPKTDVLTTVPRHQLTTVPMCNTWVYNSNYVSITSSLRIMDTLLNKRHGRSHTRLKTSSQATVYRMLKVLSEFLDCWSNTVKILGTRFSLPS